MGVILEDVAVFKVNSGGRTHEVRSKLPVHGLYGMHR